MSSDLIWCVRAPTDMKSTPVSGVFAQRVERDAAARLRFAASGDLRDGLPRQLRVKLSSMMRSTPPAANTCRCLRANALRIRSECSCLCLEIGLAPSMAGRMPPAKSMVVLQQNHVEQSHAVILTAADLDGHLVQYAHARGWFCACREPLVCRSLILSA